MKEYPRFCAVWWEDTGHEDGRLADDHPPCTVPQCSVGFEVRRTPSYIALTQSRLLDDDEQPNDGLLTIPIRCVDKISYLVEDTVEEFSAELIDEPKKRGRRRKR